MSGRRQFLIGATAGAIGVAVGAAGERVLANDAPTRPPTSGSAPT